MPNTDPTLAEMRAALAAEGLYGEPGPVNAGEPLELDGEAEAAIYWFACHYHGGPSSNLYSVIASTDPTLRSPYRPGTSSTLESEGEAAQGCYAELERIFSGKDPDWISGAAVIDSEMTYYLDEGEGSERPEWQQQEISKALTVATAAPALCNHLETVCDLLETALEINQGDGFEEPEDQASHDAAWASLEAARAALAAARGETQPEPRPVDLQGRAFDWAERHMTPDY